MWHTYDCIITVLAPSHAVDAQLSGKAEGRPLFLLTSHLLHFLLVFYSEITPTVYSTTEFSQFATIDVSTYKIFRLWLLFIFCIQRDVAGYLPSLWLSSVPGEAEKDGWERGPTRVKPSAPLGPGRSSEAEPMAADAGLDFRAGMAVKINRNL